MPEGPLGQPRIGAVPVVELEVRMSSMPGGDPDIFNEEIEAAISSESGENITVETVEGPSEDDLLGLITSKYKLSPGTITSGKFQFTSESLGRIEDAIKNESRVEVEGVFLQIS